MSIIVIPNTFSAGAVIIASQHNSNFTTIGADYNGNIDNTNIATSAAIAYSKLNLATSILNADVSASAAIVASKLDLTTGSAIGTTSPAAGKFTTLEATSTLKVGTTHQGDILYDNGTSLVRLTPGTSGQALITGGAAANPAWGTGGALTLISTTSFSAASTSGSISITNTNIYIVQCVITSASAALDIWLRFNVDSSANKYGYIYRGFDIAATAANGNSSFAAAQIVFGNMFAANSNSNTLISFTINPQQSNNGISVRGTMSGDVNTVALDGYSDFFGIWKNAATATSFAILPSTGTITGTVYLYKYALS